MKPASQRLISFAIAIVLIIAALVVFFDLVQPAYQSAQELKAEKISKQNFLDNQKATLSQVQDTIAAYQGSGNPQALASLALPAGKDESEIVHQIGVLASQYQLPIQSMTVSTPGAKSTQARSKNELSSSSSLVKPVGVLNIQIRLAGSYANFKSFLESLESNIRIMDIGGVAVTPVGKPNQDYYTYDLAVSSYYQNP